MAKKRKKGSRKMARFAAISALREKGVVVHNNVSNKELSLLLIQNGVASPGQFSVGLWYASLPKKRSAALTRRQNQPKITKPRVTDDFYDSWEWTTLRYKVILKFGRRCMCCGRTPEDGIKIHVDHIKPRSLNRELELEIDNLQILCGDCNKGKGGWDQTDFRPVPELQGCEACREREELYRLRYGKCPHCDRVLA